jgi:hypothetical protein
MSEKSGEKGGRRRVKLVEAIRKLASKWSLRKQAKGIKPPTTEGTIEGDDSDTSSHTEIPTAKEGDSWNGKIIVQGRRHNDADVHVVWKEGDFPFRDRECHDFLMDMADRMKKSFETVHEVFFAYGNGQAIISTPKTALRDLIKLQPKFILVKLKNESKGMLSLNCSKSFREREKDAGRWCRCVKVLLYGIIIMSCCPSRVRQPLLQ